jgi:hypothetical protein
MPSIDPREAHEILDAAAKPVPERVHRNRRNARFSTGPKSEEAKARSSANSLKHGLTARRVVLPGEDQAEFDQLLNSLLADHRPEGALENEMTADIAACLWRLSRARRYESAVIDTDLLLFDNRQERAPGWERLQRYIGSIERQLHRDITRLQQLQAERRKTATTAAPAPQPPERALAAGQSGFVSSDAFGPAPVVPDKTPLPSGFVLAEAVEGVAASGQ